MMDNRSIQKGLQRAYYPKGMVRQPQEGFYTSREALFLLHDKHYESRESLALISRSAGTVRMSSVQSLVQRQHGPLV